MIINMTPHPVNIVDENNEVVEIFPKSGNLIRLSSSTVSVGMIGNIPITKTKFGAAEGLPDYKDDVFYVVSQLVKSAFPDRGDLLVPAEVVRDADGRIIGCKSLGK